MEAGTLRLDTTKMGTQYRFTDDELLALLEELYEDRENRDLAEGGVAPEVLADHHPIAQSTARDRMAELADEGEVIRCDGLNPDSKEYRQSFAPAESETAWGSTEGS